MPDILYHGALPPYTKQKELVFKREDVLLIDVAYNINDRCDLVRIVYADKDEMANPEKIEPNPQKT